MTCLNNQIINATRTMNVTSIEIAIYNEFVPPAIGVTMSFIV